VTAEIEAIIAGPAKATHRDFSRELSHLALHFWRPDFTPAQAAILISDFAHDLDGVTPEELAGACEEWRRDAKSKFFPTSGQLRALVADKLHGRSRVQEGGMRLLEALKASGGAAESGPALREHLGEVRMEVGK
jgi:hypothetical protein